MPGAGFGLGPVGVSIRVIVDHTPPLCRVLFGRQRGRFPRQRSNLVRDVPNAEFADIWKLSAATPALAEKARWTFAVASKWATFFSSAPNTRKP